MFDDLRLKIRRMIEQELSAAVAEVVGDDDDTQTADSNVADSENVEAPVQAPARRRRRSRRGPRVNYGVRSRKLPKGTELTATIDKVWQYVVRQRSRVTARDVELATGLRKKSVESALWYLRQIKAIDSREIRK